jgi:acid phosphatase type 7
LTDQRKGICAPKEERGPWVSIVLVSAIVTFAIALVAPPVHAADPDIAAAGDIACGSGVVKNDCHQQATSDLLVGTGLTGVLTLGDNQYEKGGLDAFQKFYDPTWGRVKNITHPAVGNHEYGTKGAAGYFAYFGAVAAPPKAYYSFDIGAWHLIALNSNCGIVSCAAGSPQDAWLKADLASHKNTCTLAYWHHPRFSSGGHGSDNSTGPLFLDLYNAGADLVLVGHDHDYERFAPQTPDARPDPAFGVREFVVGTGGRSHYNFTSIKPNSQTRNSDTYGVLRLTLHPTSYDWRFVPEAGKTFSDSGTGDCHGTPGGPLLKLSGPKRANLSRSGSIKVTAQCATACTVRARATVRIGRGKLGSRRIKHKLASEQQVTLKVKFSRGKLRKLRTLLKRHRGLKAKVTVDASDASGKTSTLRRNIRLRG